MIQLARTALVLVSVFSVLSVGCAVSADDAAPQTDEVEQTAQALRYGNGYPTCYTIADAMKPNSVVMRNAARQCGGLKVANLQPTGPAQCRFQTATTSALGYKNWGYDCK